jgi:phthalate 4,5-dioxygenase
MLTRDENELLCRVGPGTPMGDLMRSYWVPGALSRELPEPDGAPLRLRLLGENLIAFRTTSGVVGVIGESCPHRGASMFFGRNEEEGLRCVYHGWKFDVSGRCVDMPNEPAESNFKHKIQARAYPTTERGGLVWVYLGTRSAPPPLPHIEANMLPDGEGTLNVFMRDCNYMQALEGDIDTCHVSFLHSGYVDTSKIPPHTFAAYTVADKSPRYQVADTDVGVMYGAYRPAEADSYYWRIAQFLFPFYTLTPTGVLGLEVGTRAWVPIDDSHTMAIGMGRASRNRQSLTGEAAYTLEMKPNTSDWYGRFRYVASAENDYQIDRERQKTLSFSGIRGITMQDQAVTESMGPIYQRNNERLGTSDIMIIRTRRRLIEAARALREQGMEPPGVDAPALFATRSGGVVLPRTANWVDDTAPLRQSFVQHPELSRGILGGQA